MVDGGGTSKPDQMMSLLTLPTNSVTTGDFAEFSSDTATLCVD